MKKDYIKYIFSLLLFGANGIIASNIALNSYEIVLMRSFIGSIFLIAIFFLVGQKPIFYLNKRDTIYIMISGLAMGASWMFLYEAYVQIGVSISSLLYYCGPIIVMILSPLIFQERLTKEKTIGFIVVIIGIMLVNGQWAGSDSNKFGIICGAMSAIMYAVMVIFNKKSSAIPPMENAVLQLYASFFTVLIFTLIRGGIDFHINNDDWMWILLLGILNTGIGCYLYFSSIGSLPVQTVAICGYAEPLSAVVLSVILLNENMLIHQVIGGVLIIGGAIIGELFSLKCKINISGNEQKELCCQINSD